MIIAKLTKLIEELGHKISLTYLEQDKLLHDHGHKISEYYQYQRMIWKLFYPNTDGETPLPQKPSKDIQSPEMIEHYDRLLDLQIISAPYRKQLSDIKSLARSYEKQRNELLLERQKLEKKPQDRFDF